MKYEIKELCGLNCVIRYPKDFTKTKKYPVILFLHGAGSRGNDINVLRNNPYFTITEKHKDFPFISVAPQCNKDNWFMLMHVLQEIVYKLVKTDFTDTERIYAVGPSMGGYAVWQLAMNMPHAFAAIIPICGGGMYWNVRRLMGTSVWAFHGDSDTAVYPEESVKMVKKINDVGGNAKLTVYKNTGHDSWSETYSDYNVFEWLLSCKNAYVENGENIFDDSKIYG